MFDQKAYHRQYYRDNKERLLQANQAYKSRMPLEQLQRYRANSRARYKALRQECLEHYGASCTCCGETQPAFLSFDHIEGGGQKHRKVIGGRIVTWLVKHNFPPGFQVLCHNCNQAKGFYGYCPHKGIV